ncbi:hypothetical protein PLESTB_001325600 [Pleodorina starrii]|uniref:Uncharacterized protein n=1 Tax=Pleodorina starrii TaxID=330485 RepID=A0A9W6BU16_9CHLO|nr:hypothetical protein PLESTB_001325600 [Pleodorina starrii]
MPQGEGNQPGDNFGAAPCYPPWTPPTPRPGTGMGARTLAGPVLGARPRRHRRRAAAGTAARDPSAGLADEGAGGGAGGEHLSGLDRQPMAGGQGPESGVGGAAQRSLLGVPAGAPGEWNALALMGPLAQLIAQCWSNAPWPVPVPPPPLPAAQLGPGTPGAGTAAGWIGAVPAAAAALAAMLGGAPAAGRVDAPSVYATRADWSGNPSGNLPESDRDLERAGMAAVMPGGRGTPAAPAFTGTAGVWPGGGPTLEALRAAATAAVGRSTGPQRRL